MYFVPDSQPRLEGEWRDTMTDEEIVEALTRSFERGEAWNQPTLSVS